MEGALAGCLWEARLTMRTLFIVSALVLAAVLVPQASAQSGCDPRDGPFSPCYYDCDPNFQAECTLVLGVGQRVWNYYCDRISPSC